MPFKLPEYPSSRAKPHELADFAELIALINGRCSVTLVQRYLGRIDENDYNEGIEDSDIEIEECADQMLSECENRRIAAPGGYPFHIHERAAIQYIGRQDCVQSVLYEFLLLATRLNMMTNPVHADQNGAMLMEELSAEVLKGYLGGARAKVKVFGTARQGSFAAKVNTLCQDLAEGGQFKSPDPGYSSAKDDGLDVYGWIPFTGDMRGSQLIVFAQCKTGTSWQTSKGQLNPGEFTRLWMASQPGVEPVKAMLVAEAIDSSRRNVISANCGVFFDRCRMIDSVVSLDDALYARVLAWCEGALAELRGSNWIDTNEV